MYHQFLRGKFVFRTTAVFPDMRLEQTIQRSKKSQSGITGHTSEEADITEGGASISRGY